MTCIAPFIPTPMESDLLFYVVLFLVGVGEVYQFPFRGFEYPATLFTSAASSISVYIRCLNDVAVGWKSPTHKHVIQVAIAPVCDKWRIGEDLSTSFT